MYAFFFFLFDLIQPAAGSCCWTPLPKKVCSGRFYASPLIVVPPRCPSVSHLPPPLATSVSLTVYHTFLNASSHFCSALPILLLFPLGCQFSFLHFSWPPSTSFLLHGCPADAQFHSETHIPSPHIPRSVF